MFSSYVVIATLVMIMTVVMTYVLQLVESWVR